MKLQLWRNATLLLNIDGISILVDPMLGEKGSLGKFPMVDNELLNPLVDLPFGKEELNQKLKKVDAVAVTHLHPDHWDTTAIELLDKNIPIICSSLISEQIAGYGFTDIIAVNDSVQWRNIEISTTKGQHGTGEIGEKMGIVNGFVFTTENKSVYIAGDSIWYNEIAQEIEKHQPQHIIVAGGAATFLVGDPIIMTSEDIIKVCEHAPEATVWVTHLESVSHCKEDRKFIREKISKNRLEKRCFILDDGEEVELHF
ncbi:L-ascorbate metabolism protein UlaG (beta-lactamase superfamily) [Chryseobacterium sediminis]|uniref:L-ascorbate metabolism protein UlaG (Beta-lactamase superfamily) n=1 Tax=Chryseobacterium sediminis TaxID=1679494 RepID=A0ABR6PX32_9FLAO|nr:MBL fold metallo-hydrolase [Chryseobacterium sediminis]MBB6330255.1 L-ascorbate metabolism protein UlaG (beta-lactamase superfamily) [Chryseobacterium sediminis]